MIDTVKDLIEFLDQHYEKDEPVCYILFSQADIPPILEDVSTIWGSIAWQVDDAMDALEVSLSLVMARAINDYNKLPTPKPMKKKNDKKEL